jgi:DNA-binding MarR family transcriptional regulator
VHPELIDPPDRSDCDDACGAVFRDFMGIVHRQRQLLFRIFAKQDLHPTQALCMRILASRGELNQSDLAEELLLSRPTVTRVLQRMERSGLVGRRVDEADQRQVLVALTPAGLDLQHSLEQAIGEYVAATLARLPADDLEQLARILPAWRALTEEALG